MKNNDSNAAMSTQTLRLKVRKESYNWLNHASKEVNHVFNWCNATNFDASDRNRRANAKFLSGFDLCNLSSGSSEFYAHINADAIQRICTEYATKRKSAKRRKLRWRISHGSHKSLGWIPFKAANLKRKGNALRFAGKHFRVFDREYLGEKKWRDGCFAQDSVGDWWLCLPVHVAQEISVAPLDAVGIDLGLKTIATTSDGVKLEAGKWTKMHAIRLAQAQRRGHKRQAKRIHRKIARCRRDTLHKFSRQIVDDYQKIVIGDVSSLKLVKTKMSKSVLDSGWGMFRQMLQYKGEHAGRFVEVINERNTTQECSNCGQMTGPSGLRDLVVRDWECAACGAAHDRDVNSARNILNLGFRCEPPFAGTSCSPFQQPSSQSCKTGTNVEKVAA